MPRFAARSAAASCLLVTFGQYDDLGSSGLAAITKVANLYCTLNIQLAPGFGRSVDRQDGIVTLLRGDRTRTFASVLVFNGGRKVECDLQPRLRRPLDFRPNQAYRFPASCSWVRFSRVLSRYSAVFGRVSLPGELFLYYG